MTLSAPASWPTLAACAGSSALHVPPEMLYASGSGLDPDISLEAALAQVPAVARARGMSPADEAALAATVTAMAASSRSLLGTGLVNVVELNAELEAGNMAAAGRQERH